MPHFSKWLLGQLDLPKVHLPTYHEEAFETLRLDLTKALDDDPHDIIERMSQCLHVSHPTLYEYSPVLGQKTYLRLIQVVVSELLKHASKRLYLCRRYDLPQLYGTFSYRDLLRNYIEVLGHFLQLLESLNGSMREVDLTDATSDNVQSSFNLAALLAVPEALDKLTLGPPSSSSSSSEGVDEVDQADGTLI